MPGTGLGNTANTMVKAAAGIGVASEVMQLIGYHIVAVPLMILGLVLMRLWRIMLNKYTWKSSGIIRQSLAIMVWPNSRNSKTQGRVVGIQGNCDPQTNSTCQAQFAFTAPEDNVERTFEETIPGGLTVGETVTVYYNRSNPGDNPTRSNPAGGKVFGGIIFGIAILILVFRWVKFFLVRRFKPLAALEGAQHVLGMGSMIPRINVF